MLEEEYESSISSEHPKFGLQYPVTMPFPAGMADWFDNAEICSFNGNLRPLIDVNIMAVKAHFVKCYPGITWCQCRVDFCAYSISDILVIYFLHDQSSEYT